ncbi:MAG TPA: hypothetical protein VM687_17030 [Stenotrophomonas sp.]|nr:hypothetical protein [Stenotrophomonas sp.]
MKIAPSKKDTGRLGSSQMLRRFSRDKEKGLAEDPQALDFLAPEVGLEPTTP